MSLYCNVTYVSVVKTNPVKSHLYSVLELEVSNRSYGLPIRLAV